MQSSAECLNELPLDYELAVGGMALNAMVMSDDVMGGDAVGGRDSGVRMGGLPQVLLDSEPLSQDTLPTDQSECANKYINIDFCERGSPCARHCGHLEDAFIKSDK